MPAPTTQSPAVPLPVAPVEGLTVDATSAPFSWSAVEGATGYVLQIASDEAFSNVLLEVPVGQATSVTLYSTLPADDSTLYWRVRAEQGTTWSPAAAFVAACDATFESYCRQQAQRAMEAAYSERLRRAEEQSARDRIPPHESSAMNDTKVALYLGALMGSFIVLLIVLFIFGQVTFPAEAVIAGG